MFKASDLVFVFVCSWLCCGLAFAQTARRSDEDILQRGTSPVWADVKKEDVQYNATPLGRDNLEGRSDWSKVESGRDFWSWLFGNDGSNSNWTTGSSTASTSTTFWDDLWRFITDLLGYLFWTILALLLIAGVVWLAMNQEVLAYFRRQRATTAHEDIAIQQAKYSDLPVELEQGLVGLKAQAGAFRDKGDYNRSIVYLFSYLLVELDSARCIALAKGKTNYRYLRELAPHKSLQTRLRGVITLFEEAYFGRRTITREQFEPVWEELGAFEAAIKESEKRQDASHLATAADGPAVGASSMPSWFSSVLLAILSVALAGCRTEVTNVYGTSDSLEAEMSPGGLTVFREMMKARSLDTETLSTLSPTMDKRVQTIIWAPDYFPLHSKQTLDRFEKWLNSGSKTLVYVGRDYSPQADYWEQVSNDQTNTLDARARARSKIQLSKEANHLDVYRDQYRELLLTPWFVWRQVPGPVRKVNGFQGEWADDNALANAKVYARSTLKPFTALELDGIRKELDWQPATPAGVTPPPPRKNGFALPSIFKPSIGTKTRVWNTDDEELLSIAKGIVPGDRMEATVLLASQDGSPLITEVQYKAATSKVIVLANSSVLSNLNLLNRGNRSLANKIIDRVPTGTVGFLSLDSDTPIRLGLPQEEHQGFEMLTVWPFNVMTIHAAVLAMVAVIAAFPIFGRARKTPQKSQANFADHVESLGELLRATDGGEYAKEAISKYFRIVRRDHKSEWANLQTFDPPADPQRSDQG